MFVALNKHANYPTRETCNNPFDVCLASGPEERVHVDPARNLGTTECQRAADPALATSLGNDCGAPCLEERYWNTPWSFCGWQCADRSQCTCVGTSNSYGAQLSDFGFGPSSTPVTCGATPDAGAANSDAGTTHSDASALDGSQDSGQDAGVSDPDAGATVETCGPANNRSRFEFVGNGAWDDLVLDTVTGLTWHRGVEATNNDPSLPPCMYDATNRIPREQPYCCNDFGNGRAVPPGCNWSGFKKLCEDQGWRLATVDELLEFGNNNGLCFDNWSSWSAATGTWRAALVQRLGAAVGSLEYSIPATAVAPWQAFPNYVRCVRD